jgi:predicted nucleotidyltransferase
MLDKEGILDQLRLSKADLFHRYHLVRLGLFGSYATGEAGPASDVDLLVEFEPETADLSTVKASLKATLSEILGRPVDLCRLKYLKPYFREHVERTAIFV